MTVAALGYPANKSTLEPSHSGPFLKSSAAKILANRFRVIGQALT